MLRFGLPETLEIQFLDKLRQRKLPLFLSMVSELSEVFGIHAQLARHLNVDMLDAVLLVDVNPDFVLEIIALLI